jgi:hypothetical protein
MRCAAAQNARWSETEPSHGAAMGAMTMRILSACVAFIWSAALLTEARAQQHPWAGFRVGSWSQLVTVGPGGSEPTFSTWVLRQVTSAEARVTVEIKRGDQVIASRDVPFPIPHAESRPDRRSSTTLSVRGRRLNCDVLQYLQSQTTIWQCPDVPGSTVVTQTSQSTTTLVDFEAK